PATCNLQVRSQPGKHNRQINRRLVAASAPAYDDPNRPQAACAQRCSRGRAMAAGGAGNRPKRGCQRFIYSTAGVLPDLTRAARLFTLSLLLRALSRCKPFQRRTVDLDSEPWPVRNLDDTSLVLDGGCQHGLSERVLRAVELEHGLARSMAGRIVRQHRQELQRSGEPDSRSPDVRQVAEAERIRHVGDL